MYFYNIYQNILSCKKFYNNSTYITNTFDTFRNYLDYSIETMTYYQNLVQDYPSYTYFSENLEYQKQNLITYYNNIINLPQKFLSFKNVAYIGITMKNFYVIYDDDAITYIQKLTNCTDGEADQVRKAFAKNKYNKINYFKKMIDHFQNKDDIFKITS